MGEDISSLVLALTEDASIEGFDERKAALRDQVMMAGRVERSPSSPRTSSPTSAGCDGGSTAPATRSRRGWGPPIDGMAGHYRESVEMIEESGPDSVFLPALRQELESLADLAVAGGSAGTAPTTHSAL